MAAPVVEAVATTVDTSNSESINLPSNIAAGETLIVVHAHADNSTSVSFPSGWTSFFSDSEGSTFAGDTQLNIAWRKADGSEGSTITIDTGSTAPSAAVAYRISGATDPTSTAPEAAAKSNDVSSSPDPPSISPSGGSDDYLILPCVGIAAEENASGAPSGYSNLQSENAGTQDDADEIGIATAEQGFTGISSENPGTFTYPNSHRWLATTVAIYPAVGSTGSSLPILTPPAIGA